MTPPLPPPLGYRGRLAPSPTGFLHLGHAHTFARAFARARAAGGELLLRNDDLDAARVRPEYVLAQQEDLRWLGLYWDGPMLSQSERLPRYRAALAQLHAAGYLFPCRHSRRALLAMLSAPHELGPAGGQGSQGSPGSGEPPAADDEPLYPLALRPPDDETLPPLAESDGVNWRFRVPVGEKLSFHDGACGLQQAEAGRDFGDFLVWRRDGLPSYQLACAVDDIEMGITEVVRGEDLLMSTFRQLLLIRALGGQPPAYYHCPLVRDAQGQRLAKRHDALSLRTLRAAGATPTALLAAAGIAL